MSSPRLALSFFPAAQAYKTFADYENRLPFPEGAQAEDSHRFTAIQKVPVVSHSCYDDLWFILRRQGEYGAQVEKAAANLYQHFLGYSTQIDILQEGEDYYAASRKIKNYIDWAEALKFISINNGNLVFKQQNEKPIINLGKIAAITDFFADTDCHSSNFGLQIHDDVCLAFKIDNEHTFSFEHQASEGSCVLEEELQQSSSLDVANYLQSEIYQTEKQCMLRTIAETDFSLIEDMLRKIITADQRSYARKVILELIAASHSNPIAAQSFATDEDNEADEAVPAMSREMLEEQLKQLDAADASEFGVEKVLAVLKERHEQLREKILHSAFRK